MNRRRVICVYLCILAAWMQFLAPVAAMSSDMRLDSLGVICRSDTADSIDRSQPAHHQHHDHCCLLCHAYLGAAPLGDRPAFTAFDFGIASPLRWRLARSSPLPHVRREAHPPRGPPSLA